MNVVEVKDAINILERSSSDGHVANVFGDEHENVKNVFRSFSQITFY